MAIAVTDWRDDTAVASSVSTANLLSDLRFTVSNLDNLIATLKKKRISYDIALTNETDPTSITNLKAIIAGIDADIKAATAQRATATDQITKLSAAAYKAATDVSNYNDSNTNTSAPTITAPSASDQDVMYNIGGVIDAYFGSMRLVNNGKVGLTPDSKGRKFDDSALYINNTPARVTDALQLWSTSQASKGMIQTYIPKSNYLNNIFAGVDATTAADLQTATSITNLKKYGFQFHYNPADISMSISGGAAVDYMKYVSGPSKVMPDSGANGSSISFSVVLNRIFDFQYLTSSGTLRDNLTVKQVYGSAAPEGASGDLKEIYDKGTMYDVEFLLKTIVGFEMNTQLRGVTADLGFLIGRLIELHIGKSMRYLVNINGLSITHHLFDNRMVPLYSTVSISANRVPDFMGYATGA